MVLLPIVKLNRLTICLMPKYRRTYSARPKKLVSYPDLTLFDTEK